MVSRETKLWQSVCRSAPAAISQMEPAVGGGYKPLYNRDGVLRFPRDAEASVLIDRERATEYKTHAYGDVKDRPLFVAST